MSLTLTELKTFHDKAFNHNQVTRERGADDLVFYWVTQWDDNLLQDSQLAYRGEFNILRKGGRQIMSDLRSNPVQVDFDPKDPNREDGADLADGLYRSDDRRNTSIEAYDYASQDSVVCGFGAWELFTEYETNQEGDDKQVIRRRYIPEANNKAFCDPNAKRLDKSDANYWSILTAYSDNGYKDLVEKLTGERPDTTSPSFKHPEQSYTFPWFAQDGKIYVTAFYHREEMKDTVLKMMDPFGEEVTIRESDLNDQMDDLIDSGYQIESSKDITRWKITRYIASGANIIEEKVIAGQNIPVVPVYGERSFVEDEEHWEGVTRLAKDPQRLRNFQLSYLADIVSRSPRTKPIFTPEQVQGFEDMYGITGAENNYPYLLQNMYAADGQALPMGPVSQMPEQKIPDALITSIDLSRQAVEDVANPGLPQNIADPDISGKAVVALQNRLDQQSYIYQHNMKFAKRRDGDIWASMASEVYVEKRTVTLTLPNGERKKVQMMDEAIDKETGEPIVINNISNLEFDVFADISPSYSSQKEATIERLGVMIGGLAPGDPMRLTLMLKQMVLMDGVQFDDVRKYANKQLLIQGIREPETPEEEQLLAEISQQQEEPSADMVLAKAEELKGQAAVMREQRELMKTKADMQRDIIGTQVDVFEAQTDRMDAQTNAAKAGADIKLKRIDAFGKQIDNVVKMSQRLRVSVSA